LDAAWRSWKIIANTWGGFLQREGAKTLHVERAGYVGSVGYDIQHAIEDLAARVDCAIVGLGTCGSCTSFTINDSITIENAHKPVVAVVTTEFETHGRNMARFLNHDSLEILVLPYPLEARPNAELQSIAEEFYPKALELLGVVA